MSGWILDLRVAWRSLRQTPQLALVAIAAVALSIGAASTMFAVLDGVVLRPLPFPHAERLMAIWERDPAVPNTWVQPSQLAVRTWQRESSSFEALVAARNRSFTLTSFEDGDTPLIREVGQGYFEMLGIAPLLGRTFNVEEDRPGGPGVILLSYELWQRRFGGDPGVVGQTTELDGEPLEIVGVMPPATDNPVFATEAHPQAWRPVALPESGLDRRVGAGGGYVVLGRLRPDVSLEQARAEFAAVSARLTQEYPDIKREALVVPAAERLVRDLRPAVLLLFGAGLFVLLVACGNVANLLLTRAVERRREIALRQALGAGTHHLVRQLLTGLLLSLVGSAAGLAATYWGIRALPWLVAAGASATPFRFELDAGVVAFTVALAALTGIVFGLVPALHALRPDLAQTLGAGAVRTTADAGRQLLRRGLVVGEVALSLVLLIGAGLMLQSFARLQALDPGFDPDQLLTFRVSTRGPEYRDPARRAAFFLSVSDRLREAPGVVAAGGVQFMPLYPSFGQRPVVPEGETVEAGAEPLAVYMRTTPGFFEAMRIPVLRGRALDERDTEVAAPVAVVSRTLALRLFGTGDPIGRRLRTEPSVSREIVGVVGDVRSDQSPPEPGAILYVPIGQDGDQASMGFVVRTRGAPLAALPEAERAVRAVDRAMPVYMQRTMQDLLAAIDARQRVLRSLLGVFAVLALSLALTGVYAVLSYSVSRRTRELGIRAALGAGRRELLAEVLGGALGLALGGIAAGAALALALSGLLQSQLYGVTATDPLTYLGLAVALVATVLVASSVPARRAASVDPAVALREE
jgi:putative ABC transport system permease protein